MSDADGIEITLPRDQLERLVLDMLRDDDPPRTLIRTCLAHRDEEARRLRAQISALSIERVDDQDGAIEALKARVEAVRRALADMPRLGDPDCVGNGVIVGREVYACIRSIRDAVDPRWSWTVER